MMLFMESFVETQNNIQMCEQASIGPMERGLKVLEKVLHTRLPLLGSLEWTGLRDALLVLQYVIP